MIVIQLTYFGYRQLMVAHVIDELDIGFYALDTEEMEYALQLQTTQRFK